MTLAVPPQRMPVIQPLITPFVVHRCAQLESFYQKESFTRRRIFVNKRLFLFFCVLPFSLPAFSQVCEEVFPDGLSSSSTSSEITFRDSASVINSPDNILDTQVINDASGGVSCDGSPCAISGGVVPEIDFTSFSTGEPDIVLNFAQTLTVSPGDYGSLDLQTQSTLTMEPGVYTFSGMAAMAFEAEIIVSSPGTVAIYVNGDVFQRFSAVINADGGDKNVFLYSRANVALSGDSSFNGAIYARGSLTLDSDVAVTGAMTAGGEIIFGSRATVTYAPNIISSINFNGSCQLRLPDPVAEWRLDEREWDGSVGEVLDNSSNQLHGQAVSVDGGAFPDTSYLNPVVEGNPGTCRYGDFNGALDGYVEIADPGTNSVLDQDSEFTVTAWLNASTLPTTGLYTVVSKGSNFEIHINTSGEVIWDWGGGAQSITSSQSVVLDSWYHVAVTFTSGAQFMYLDGVLVGQNNSVLAITTNDNSVFIGTGLATNSNRFDGSIDEVRIYEQAFTVDEVRAVQLNNRTCGFTSALSQLSIDIGSSNASTCSPKAIVISARDTNNDVLESYTGTVSLSTSTGNGDWSVVSAQGSLLVGVGDTGAATYQFEQTGLDSGQVTLALSNTRAESLTVTVQEDPIAQTSNTITYSENAFVVTSTDNLASDVIAGRRHAFRVDMFQQDPDTGICQVADAYDNDSVKAWLTRSVNDPGGAAPTINNSTLSESLSLPGSEPATANINLDFNSGSAAFSLDTSDVGQFSLEFLDDGNSFSESDISGASDVLTVRPFAFGVTVAGNPAASSASSSAIYRIAGETFAVSVEARAWSSSDDTNNNGQADVYEDADPLNNNALNGAVLPSFGLEGESIALSSTVAFPSGGANPGLVSSNSSSDGRIIVSFTAGSGSTNEVYFPDVGIILINAAINGGQYLSASTASTQLAVSQSVYVGRFIPSYFDLSVNSFAPACGSFTYLSQARELDLLITARNTRGEVTELYAGDFIRLNESSGTVSLGAVDNTASSDLSGRVGLSGQSYNWTSGQASLLASIFLNRDALLEAPLTNVAVGVTVTDSDGVTVRPADLDLDTDNDSTNDLFTIGVGEYRFGRLVLPSAYGPESAELKASLTTEYWDGDWRRSISDSCTQIANSDIVFPNGAITDAANLTTAVGSGASTASFDFSTATAVNITAGDAGLRFSAPGATNTGSISVDIDLSTYPWLQFDWNQDGAFTDAALPTAEFSFGSYRGNDRIIYWQEVFSN